MSLKKHLRELRPNAEWGLLETLGKWLHEKLPGDLGRTVMLAGIAAVVQRIRGVPYDLWILALIFLGSLGLLAYAYVRDRRRSRETLFLGEEDQTQINPIPSRISPRGEASREKITVLSRAYAQPASAAARQVANKICDRLRNSEDVKDQTIALFVKRYPFFRCSHASSVLGSTLDDGSDKDNIELLEQQLREFFNGYQDLVEWTSCLVRVYSFPSSEDSDYKIWQENHRMFYQELKRLIAADDFFGLRRSLPEQWVDFPR